MKNRTIFVVLPLILAVFGLINACAQPTANPSGQPPNNPPVPAFTVTFEADGGNPAPGNQVINSGDKVTEPFIMYKADYGFGGWYKDEDYTTVWDFNNDVVTDNITLYAKWEPAIIVPGTNFMEKMQWLNVNAQSGGSYIMEFDADESIDPTTLSYSGKNNITITLKGIGTERTISLNISGSMFTVESGVTLILDDNLKLQGRNNNYASLVRINYGANLVLNSGAKIANNTQSFYVQGSNSSYGGGVYVTGGAFIMNGGEISGNSAYCAAAGTASGYGGGLYVTGGAFTMNGGKISDNSAYCSAALASGYGGGVYVTGGAFTMNGGEISDNSGAAAGSSQAFGGGGGIYVSGTFTMSGGKILNNSSPYGGGVYVSGTFIMSDGKILGNISSYGHTDCYGSGVCVFGEFTMNGGEISGNSSSPDFNHNCYGGGVYVSGRFTMNGGKISNNSCSSSISPFSISSGGGVYIAAGIFTMNSGEISDNSCIANFPFFSCYGGGVFVNSNVFFNKIGGTIFGYSEEDNKSNVVKYDSGAVVQNQGHAIYIINSDSNYIKRKETTSGPENNLSYNGTITPSTWSENWNF